MIRAVNGKKYKKVSLYGEDLDFSYKLPGPCVTF